MILHHIGIIVKEIKKNILIYEKLGYICLSELTIDTIQNNKVIFLKSSNETQVVELIEPIDYTSSVYNFTEGYHHICYDVSNINNFVDYFKTLRIGKIFTQYIMAPVINNREVVFALLNNGLFVEFIVSR